MLRSLLRSRWVARVSHGVPVGRLLQVADLAIVAGRHLGRLDAVQRRRLLVLLARSRGRPSTLNGPERRELLYLFARLEPRLFLGSAVRRLSPLPVPKRLLYGPRGSAARAALERGD